MFFRYVMELISNMKSTFLEILKFLNHPIQQFSFLCGSHIMGNNNKLFTLVEVDNISLGYFHR